MSNLNINHKRVTINEVVAAIKKIMKDKYPPL